MLPFLGPAIPVVLLLWRILEREHDERIKVQEQHAAAMAKQADVHADMVKSQTQATMEAANAMKDLAASVREFIVQDRQEHKEIIDTIHNEARLKELA